MFKEEITAYCKNCFELEQQLDQNKDRLKAKEQECEELNADNISLRDRVGKLERAILRRNEQLDQLKTENEELKNKTFRYEELLKHSAMAQNTYTAEEVNIITGGIKFVGRGLIIEENIKLHKTLTEIKEIAEAHKKDESVWNPYRQLDKILQKISECEVENEQN